MFRGSFELRRIFPVRRFKRSIDRHASPSRSRIGFHLRRHKRFALRGLRAGRH